MTKQDRTHRGDLPYRVHETITTPTGDVYLTTRGYATEATRDRAFAARIANHLRVWGGK